jgi:hypothetical protein
MTTERRHAGALRASCLGLSLGAMLFGCSAGVPRVASDLEAVVPAELHADYIAFTTNCNKCHDLERPLRAHIDDVRHWDAYVSKMMRTAGSAISARESPKILRFLYWYTERKQRLDSERSKEVRPPVPEKAPQPAPAPAAPPPQAAPVAPSAPPEPPPSTVDPQAPAQINKGEGAP